MIRYLCIQISKVNNYKAGPKKNEISANKINKEIKIINMS
jgi:hypothetical protein